MTSTPSKIEASTLVEGETKAQTCRVPMFAGAGSPSGFCDAEAYGEQYPQSAWHPRWQDRHRPYCAGACCFNHGGPAKDGVRFFVDGTGPTGRQMWCATMPDFVNLQESPAGFHENGDQAVRLLSAAIAKAVAP